MPMTAPLQSAQLSSQPFEDHAKEKEEEEGKEKKKGSFGLFCIFKTIASNNPPIRKGPLSLSYVPQDKGIDDIA
jgi:hypothetical protein